MAKILIIDDSSTSRESISSILKEEGHKTIEASNGLIGLQKFKENADVSVIFVDVNMPQMDGLEFLANLRRMSKDIPVVVLTTESEKEKIDLARTYKASAWIDENNISGILKTMLESGVADMTVEKVLSSWEELLAASIVDDVDERLAPETVTDPEKAIDGKKIDKEHFDEELKISSRENRRKQ